MALELLIVGAGRDGTVSLSRVVVDLYRENGIDGAVAHEYEAAQFYNSFCLFRETNDPAHLDRLERLVRECPYRAVVGNGYASVLPMFARHWPGLKVVHLRRKDEAAFVRSFVAMQRMFPQNNVYYGAAGGEIRRVAAFHLGEMTRAEWDALPLEAKFSWYYHYTHREIARHAPLFRHHMGMFTEDISSEAALARLARFACGEEARAVGGHRLNAFEYLKLDQFPPEAAGYVHWLLGRVDAGQIVPDAAYPALYFTNAFITWVGYHATGQADAMAPALRMDDTRLRDTLDRFVAAMQDHVRVAQAVRHSLAPARAA
ncbi:hypothetical protein [Urbifossiella limnaea]|uniref:Sulfotransferase n=1 Tax=Urbifossiella limnaea TaxID=2528023 RepID=A0A517XPZ6_9BACT|nr:hypothetical protein [Urbifossiella limnaea]QDU19585.1 hypothetical protein ETAA1_15150 [Urbifossiella limnaea]